MATNHLNPLGDVLYWLTGWAMILTLVGWMIWVLFLFFFGNRKRSFIILSLILFPGYAFTEFYESELKDRPGARSFFKIGVTVVYYLLGLWGTLVEGGEILGMFIPGLLCSFIFFGMCGLSLYLSIIKIFSRRN